MIACFIYSQESKRPLNLYRIKNRFQAFLFWLSIMPTYYTWYMVYINDSCTYLKIQKNSKSKRNSIYLIAILFVYTPTPELLTVFLVRKWMTNLFIVKKLFWPCQNKPQTQIVCLKYHNVLNNEKMFHVNNFLVF